MRKIGILALAILVTCSIWLFAERQETASEVYLATSFDFSRYPACPATAKTNCIRAIRFYDADSNQRLAEVETNSAMSGKQQILGKVKTSALHRAYAVTVYVDGEGHRREGPRGQTTELREAPEGK